MNSWDIACLEKIKQEGANAYWDDICFCDGPYGVYPAEGFEQEHQAWSEGWNQAEHELIHGVKTDDKVD